MYWLTRNLNNSTKKGLDMSPNKFVTILDDIGTGLKKFFSSPVTAEVATDGIDIAEIAFPQLDTLWNGLKSSIAAAQALAQSANPNGETTTQVTALVLSDAQQVFQAYGAAQNPPVTIETPQQTAIINAFLNLLKQIPTSSNTTTTNSAA